MSPVPAAIGRHAGGPKDRPMRGLHRAAAVCAFAACLAAAIPVHAGDEVRGLIEEDGVVRFNGFRIEQNTGRNPLDRGRVLDQPPRAEAVIPTAPGARKRVVVDMTLRYRPPEVMMPYLPVPSQAPAFK